jgi:hypothetical protein
MPVVRFLVMALLVPLWKWRMLARTRVDAED